MCLVLARIPGESYRRGLGSLSTWSSLPVNVWHATSVSFFEIFLETLFSKTWFFSPIVRRYVRARARARVCACVMYWIFVVKICTFKECVSRPGAVSTHCYLLLCSCDVFWSLIVSLVCWLSIGTVTQTHHINAKTRTNVTFTQSNKPATFTPQSIATFCNHTNQHQCKTNKQTTTTTTTTKPTCTQSNKQSTVIIFKFFISTFTVTQTIYIHANNTSIDVLKLSD